MIDTETPYKPGATPRAFRDAIEDFVLYLKSFNSADPSPALNRQIYEQAASFSRETRVKTAIDQYEPSALECSYYERETKDIYQFIWNQSTYAHRDDGLLRIKGFVFRDKSKEPTPTIHGPCYPCWSLLACTVNLGYWSWIGGLFFLDDPEFPELHKSQLAQSVCQDDSRSLALGAPWPILPAVFLVSTYTNAVSPLGKVNIGVNGSNAVSHDYNYLLQVKYP
jgi:hypothetical protein